MAGRLHRRLMVCRLPAAAPAARQHGAIGTRGGMAGCGAALLAVRPVCRPRTFRRLFPAANHHRRSAALVAFSDGLLPAAVPAFAPFSAPAA